jgi:hypothetical protein
MFNKFDIVSDPGPIALTAREKRNIPMSLFGNKLRAGYGSVRKLFRRVARNLLLEGNTGVFRIY